MTTPPDPFVRAAATAATIAHRTGVDRHDVAVVLGSGWAGAADRFGTADELPFAELGGFPPATVSGHVPVLRSVVVDGRRVLLFLARVHGYEGHPPATVVHGIRSAVLAGCRTVVLTNAAGGIRDGMAVGQPVLISDHLNLTGSSPLTGPQPPAPYDSRFVDLTDLYEPRLRALAHSVDHSLTEGVYAALPGPHYETPAEIGMLRALGADLVGMSTALEAIAARHLGAAVLGISLVTNLAAGVTGERLDHAEVLQVGAASAERMCDLLRAVIGRL